MEPSTGQEDDVDLLTNASVLDLVNGTIILINDTCHGDYCDEQLYAVPTGLIVLLSFFYGSISVLAVVGNFLVMWIVATARRMQNVTNCYIANLALADIVIGLFAIPFQFQAALLQRWVLPYFMCAFCPFVQALSVNVSVFTLTAIAIDRHRAILTPLRNRPFLMIRQVIVIYFHGDQLDWKPYVYINTFVIFYTGFFTMLSIIGTIFIRNFHISLR